MSYLCDSLSFLRWNSSSSINYASLHEGTRRVFQVIILTNLILLHDGLRTEQALFYAGNFNDMFTLGHSNQLLVSGHLPA